MSNLPVTCIIPVRNGASTIERAVKSAIDAGCDYVWVYDDASTDNTRKLVDGMANTYPYKVCYAHGLSIRGGVNFARNFLIDNAEDGLIIPLDSDDTLHNIAPLVAAWNPGTWVYGNHIEVQDGNETLVKGVPAGSLPRKNISGVTFLFHRDDWQKVGGYNPNYAYCEDWSFQCNLTHNGIKPVYVDTTVYTRYMKPEGNERSMKANLFWNFYRDMCRMDYPSVFTGT